MSADRWSEAGDFLPCMDCGRPLGPRHADCKSSHVRMAPGWPAPVTFYPIGSSVGVSLFDVDRAEAYARRWGGTLVFASGERREVPMPAWLAQCMPKSGTRQHAPDEEWR